KAPLSPVKAVYLTPVASFCTTMSAPGMSAPDESTTVPESDAAVLPPCARAREVMVRTNVRRRTRVSSLRLMRTSHQRLSQSSLVVNQGRRTLVYLNDLCQRFTSLPACVSTIDATSVSSTSLARGPELLFTKTAMPTRPIGVSGYIVALRSY